MTCSLDDWLNNNDYFNDLAVFGVGFFHPGGLTRTTEAVKDYQWRDKKVLDIGCGMGTTMQLLKYHGADVYGVDSSEYMLNAAMLNGISSDKLLFNSLENIKFEPHSFNYIFFEGVLGFVEDPILALLNAADWIMDHGSIIISEWEPHERGIKVDIDYGFNVFANTDSSKIVQELEKNGLNVKLNTEEDIAKPFLLTIENAFKRVTSYFRISSLNNHQKKLVKRKINMMHVVLSKPIKCTSYLARIEKAELNN